VQKRVDTFATSLMQNNGNGSFTLVPLPDAAQLAPVYGISGRDVDGDGVEDLMLAGNFDGFKPEIARMSESSGLVLKGAKGGKFTAMPRTVSGFVVPGQTREVLQVRTRDGALVFAARNNERPLVFRAGRGAP
jgi:enediyne biosynthesis protein E4